MSKSKATVLWFNPDKGFGYLKTDSGHLVFLYGQEIGGDAFGLNVPRIPKKHEVLEITYSEESFNPLVLDKYRARTAKFIE